jgi:CubicO group peptidase (beta-lactamase class C family)
MRRAGSGTRLAGTRHRPRPAARPGTTPPPRTVVPAVRWGLRLAAAIAILAGGRAAAGQSLPADIDAQVARAMREFQVPGMAVAAVRGGEVVLARGYGVRRLGGPEPVDAHTRFGIGSNTKAMTAVLMAMLVDEGRVRWDDRVVDHLPEFALADSVATHRLTIRDLFAHRSGLGPGAGDLLFFPGTGVSRADAVARVRRLPLRTGFRERYGYGNLLYVTAGALIERVTGKSWEENLRERLLDPLEMGDARAGSDAFAAGANVAAPHLRLDGRLQAVAPASFDAGGPAGSVNGSAADLARWMIAELDSGRAGGRRLWSTARTRELWAAQTPVPVADPPPELPGWRANFVAYGLGVVLRDYRGLKLVYHAGEVPGYYSHVYLVPDRGIGVAVLTSAETPASHAVAMRIVDALIGAPESDWTAGMVAVADRAEAAADRAEAADRAARDSTRGPTLPVTALVGTYRDGWLGRARVAVEGSGVVLRFVEAPTLAADAIHWDGDTFRLRWRDRSVPDAFATFVVEDGRVVRIALRAASPRAHFRYDFHDLDLRPLLP